MEFGHAEGDANKPGANDENHTLANLLREHIENNQPRDPEKPVDPVVDASMRLKAAVETSREGAQELLGVRQLWSALR
ncbi:MAG: hypothetical protein J2P36_39140, partial [Ktedonobacteraceae bacterium]|nr:hypothetical protein [Ktedonobacteraceae bacterium]